MQDPHPTAARQSLHAMIAVDRARQQQAEPEALGPEGANNAQFVCEHRYTARSGGVKIVAHHIRSYQIISNR